MKSVHLWLKVAGGTAVLAVLLAGAAWWRNSATTVAAAAATSAPPGTGAISVASAAATISPSPVLGDGRNPVYLTGLDTAQHTVTFDLIEFLTGDAAKAEWKKEHPEQPDGPDNDYMIINNNKKLRTLPVAAGAQCVVLSTLGGTDTTTISFADLPAYLKQQNKGMTLTSPDIALLPFWLTVQHGTVTKVEEQFLP
jgi:hypothetical protein